MRSWFTPWGWTYRPVSFTGFALLTVAGAF